MDDKRLKEEYKETFDNIHAPEYLKMKILQKKSKKRNYRPIIALASTVAAAVTIFVALNNYDFAGGDDSGVISQTTVVESEKPKKYPVKTNVSQTEEPNESELQEAVSQQPVQSAMPTATATAVQKSSQTVTSQATQKPSQNKATAKPTEATKPKSTVKPTAKPKATAKPKVTEKPKSTIKPTATEKVVFTTKPISEPETAVEEKTSNTLSTDRGREAANPETESADVSPGMNTAEGKNKGRAADEIQIAAQSAEEEQNSAQGYSVRMTENHIQTEEWNNKKYFDYIGNDIVSKTEVNSDFSYIGGESNFVGINADGKIINDEWNFAFESPDGGFVNIITSKKNTETVLPPNAQTININGVNAVISETEGSLTCYIQHNGVMYTICTTSVTKEALVSLITNLIA